MDRSWPEEGVTHEIQNIRAIKDNIYISDASYETSRIQTDRIKPFFTSMLQHSEATVNQTPISLALAYM
jgi:hypothetical protein